MELTNLEAIESRLPELEWQLSKVGSYFSSRLLPRGLFRVYSETDKSRYVEEIRVDLAKLKTQSNENVARHLAKRIEQKINVLVMVCCQNPDKNVSFGNDLINMDTITTRQQWFETLEKKIVDLTKQKEALSSTLKKRQHLLLPEERMVIQKEIGIIEHQLTCTQEKIAELLFEK